MSVIAQRNRIRDTANNASQLKLSFDSSKYVCTFNNRMILFKIQYGDSNMAYETAEDNKTTLLGAQRVNAIYFFIKVITILWNTIKNFEATKISLSLKLIRIDFVTKSLKLKNGRSNMASK